MKEQILAHKPASIFDVVPADFFIELNTGHDEYLKCKNYYEVYYAIAKHYKPKKILEIGVRYGYSLASMICGYPDVVKILAIDCDSYVHNSLQTAANNIAKYIQSNAVITYINQSSHAIGPLIDTYDLVHIDGDHTYAGKIQDLNFILGKCKVVIVDDYHFISDVRKAADDWIAQNKNVITNHFVIDSHRGTLVIEF